MQRKNNISLIYAQNEIISLIYAQNEIISLIYAEEKNNLP